MKEVTIVIPNYNCGKYIVRCIYSVLAQYDVYKIIIADDCSTDNSYEVSLSTDSGCLFISNKKNLGSPSYGINKAIEMCDTKYFMHVDSDDYLAINAIKTLLENIGDADYIYGNLIPVDINDNILSKWKFQHYDNKSILELIFRRGGSGVVPMFGLFKTEWLKKHLWSNLFHSEDTMTCVNYCLAGWVTKYIDYDFYFYRQRPESLSSKKDKKLKAMEIITKKCFHSLYEN